MSGRVCHDASSRSVAPPVDPLMRWAAGAKQTVTELLDRFGFDTVDAGPLADSWRIQPGTPGYGPQRNAEELRADLAAATRHSR